jgi:hypothetical protein
LRRFVLALLLLLIVPIGASATRYWLGDRSVNWMAADRSSAGLLPNASEHPEPLVRVFAARTVRWRGIFAVHSWVVVKDANARSYTRYDYTAWGEPIRVNGFVADGRWFGDVPQLIAAADGEVAARMIPKIREAVATYKPRAYGDYRAWPGPNSNTFVAAVLSAVPELKGTLPPTAIGKDYPVDGAWLGRTPSRTGLYLTLGGYAGITLGWIEGIELNVLGAVLGFDLRHPAIKLPGLGRIGMPTAAL